MSGIEIKYDLSSIRHVSDVMHRAQKLAPDVLRLAVKHTGGKATSAMRSALVDQTGLKRGTLVRAVKGSSAGLGYIIKSHGGNIRLKFFRARETRKGVSAAPWNARRIYPGTFMKGGRFPNRKPLGMGGQVMQRAGSRRLPLHGVKSGLFIPEEMVKGQSEAAFYGVLQSDLAPRLEHELSRILAG
ncbi:hypothetical protein JQ633_12510 [Bradyrhizobium tropiciagri]|uniref:hypothetical protein n=1 Tax=Bradyrhizobium tropiciagri TaxID=312253 RepID=UPI001BA715EC|nr:hypothetical protein [Bradyrhizobium tropiciagri]MBR0871185.1 hypothetical protein [Bradyrhizobium tropiciagri]